MATREAEFLNRDKGIGFITPTAGEKHVLVDDFDVMVGANTRLEASQGVVSDLTPGRERPKAQNLRAR